MKKVISLLVIIFFFSSLCASTFAVSLKSGSEEGNNTKIDYPTGEDFLKLRNLIDGTFSPSSNKYGYNCISNGSLCPNYKYTSVIEKAIKLIVTKTYSGNEKFYNSIFQTNRYGGYYDYDTSSASNQKAIKLKTVLDTIPKGTSLSDWKSFSFGSSIGGELLDASFGINFSENANNSSMLSAIEAKIKDIKRRKCQEDNKNDYNACPWNGDVSNKYLPTQAELYKEIIYLNQGSVKIESLKDDIEYTVSGSLGETPSSLSERFQYKTNVDKYTDDVLNEKEQQLLNLDESGSSSESSLAYIDAMNKLRENPNLRDIAIAKKLLEQESINSSLSSEERNLISWLKEEVTFYETELNKANNDITYELKYKKVSYTLEEAKSEITKKNTTTTDVIFNRNNGGSSSLPCSLSSNYATRTECSEAIALRRDVTNAIGAYYSDRERYPDTIDDLTRSYLEDENALPDFKKNFTYKNTTSKDNNSIPNFEIEYIGHIGENSSESDESDGRKDYTKLMSGSTVPEIPAIFSHIPRDSMVLYVKNPANLIDILNQKSNTSQRLSGLDVSESIKEFMMTFFELKSFEQIQNNLKHEMAVVVNNLDATAPDIVLILSEADRNALSPTANARVVGSKDGFIFIADSKDTLEQFTNLTKDKSLSDAPDFHYVWWKKSALIHDAFIFVGDAFFEKMLTFESYIAHYRKYRDYNNLSAIQELVWAYTDAFGKTPDSLNEFTKIGLTTLSDTVLAQYSIENGLVKHKNIGTLKSIRTLPESQYDLSTISRSEIEDYRTNVQGYREVWRSSLDPMGIVINRYGDGLEMDFFMTPIPSSMERSLFSPFFGNRKNSTDSEQSKIISGILKDSLSFVTNPHIRMGLLSFAFGYDAKKLQTVLNENKEMNNYLQEFNQEVLEGKDIFDYIAGEFAFSVGDLDPDILDGWNIDKIDVYLSVQVTNEEKGKELIDIIRTRILDEMGNSRGDEADLIKGFLAKPLIEDYNGKKIYYVEGLPIPFVGKIGFAYTFVDDFFMIGLNRSTIKNVIDVAKSGDDNKKSLLHNTSFSPGTFFVVLFDGVGTSDKLEKLYEKNKTSIPKYTRYLNIDNVSNDSAMKSLLGKYYVTQDRNKRLAIESKSFSYSLGSLIFSGETDKISVKIDQDKLTSLSGATLQMWDNIKTDTSFPKEVLGDSGIPLESFLVLKNIEDITALNLIIQLDSAFAGTDSLLRNTTFGLNMGDDEVGFNVKVFRQAGGGTGVSVPISSEMMLLLIIGGIVLIGGIGVVIIFRRKKVVSNLVDTGMIQIQEMPVSVPQPSSLPPSPSIAPPPPLTIPETIIAPIPTTIQENTPISQTSPPEIQLSTPPVVTLSPESELIIPSPSENPSPPESELIIQPTVEDKKE